MKNDFLAWRYGERKVYSGADVERWLDTMTYQHYLEKVMGLRPEVTRYIDPVLAAAIGLGSDVLSAFAAQSVGMPGFQSFSKVMAYPRKWEEVSPLTWHSFPGGNDGFARCFVKALIPDAIMGTPWFTEVMNGRVRFDALDRRDQEVRLRLGATVVRVEHVGPADSAKKVRVTWVQGGQARRLEAKAVVMAGGGWITRRVVRDLPEKHQQCLRTVLSLTDAGRQRRPQALAVSVQTWPDGLPLVRRFWILLQPQASDVGWQPPATARPQAAGIAHILCSFLLPRPNHPEARFNGPRRAAFDTVQQL